MDDGRKGPDADADPAEAPGQGRSGEVEDLDDEPHQAADEERVATKTEWALMRRLLDKYPELFTLHPMPARGMLFLTCLHPSLLSAPLRHQLAALPKPIRVPPSAPPPKERDVYAKP